jgi:hypothetical protein
MKRKTILFAMSLILIITGLLSLRFRKTSNDPMINGLHSSKAITVGSEVESEVSATAGNTNPAPSSMKDTGAGPEESQAGCHRIRLKHNEQNRTRDLEEFTHDLNAFVTPDANPGSVCVKVNRNPVHHRIRKGKLGAEVWVGSVIGPDSEIELSYCTGKQICREPCKVKSENRVDDLLNEEELTVLGDRELESKVRELGKLAGTKESLLDSSVIRNWNQIGTQEWSCRHN